MSSISKKQTVALSGLVLILFVIGHLAGNLTIYGGPEMFNGYAAKLKHMRPFLNVVEAMLLFVFIVHMFVTMLLIHENAKAKGGFTRYSVDAAVGNRSWATRLMGFSGAYILFFVIWHLLDFTFIDHQGVRGFINGQSLGVYGVVVNAFANPLHSALYILAMVFIGLHLTHGIDSVVQTFGLKRPAWSLKLSKALGILVALGYSSIPLYVLFVLKKKLGL